MIETAPGLRRKAQVLAQALPALMAEARQLAASLRAGSHGRRRSGPGDAFWQFRRSQPGDSLAAIDWRQSAKSDPLYVREAEWAAGQTVGLWIDSSASMAWRSSAAWPEKRAYGLLIGVALALLLTEGGERVALLGEDLPAAVDPAGVERLAERLLAPVAAAAPSAPPARGGHVVLISDFLMAPDEVAALFAALSGGGASGQLVHLLDPAEETLPFTGRVRFRGLEGEGEVTVARTEDLRAAYRERVAALRADLRAAAGALGWGYAASLTDAPAAATLARLHLALRGR